MKTPITLTLVLGLSYGWSVPASADSVIELKNGRRLHVKQYREDKGVIKFDGFGGEITIGKDQIKSISRDGHAAPGDLDLTQQEIPARQRSSNYTPGGEEAREKPLHADEQQAAAQADYLEQIKTLDAKLKVAQDRYATAIRGTASEEPTQLVTDDQIKSRQDDLVARFKDAQNNPSDPAPVKLVSPSPFSSLPPTVSEVQPPSRTVSPYDTPQALTDRQQELLQMRNQMLEIEKERDRLVREMQQKNKTGGTATVQ